MQFSERALNVIRRQLQVSCHYTLSRQNYYQKNYHFQNTQIYADIGRNLGSKIIGNVFSDAVDHARISSHSLICSKYVNHFHAAFSCDFYYFYLCQQKYFKERHYQDKFYWEQQARCIYGCFQPLQKECFFVPRILDELSTFF